MILKSNTTASELIERVKDNLEVSNPLEDSVIYSILNRFLAEIYSSLIMDIRMTTLEKNGDGIYFLSSPEESALYSVRVFDVVKVSAEDFEYERVGEDYRAEAFSGGEHLYKLSDTGVLSLYSSESTPEVISVYYRAIPSLHSFDSGREIELPEEFIDLAEAKLYCEIYRLLGEDKLCANWSEQYNMLMTRFGVWLEVHGL